MTEVIGTKEGNGESDPTTPDSRNDRGPTELRGTTKRITSVGSFIREVI